MTTVLLADDNIYMRNLLKRILIESGYDVAGEASNGDEAIALYKKLQPDLWIRSSKPLFSCGCHGFPLFPRLDVDTRT